jgi:amino acid permease
MPPADVCEVRTEHDGGGEPMAATHAEGSEQLQKGLRRRHMTMISLGGVIGAGLFVGAVR